MMKNIILVFGFMAALWTYADADDHKEKKHKSIAPVTNELYKKSCGSCHFAYQPGLLPSASWDKIMTAGHFGEIEKRIGKEITDYLKANSADKSNSELSRKILSSLKGNAPGKITDVPYIRKKHREINKDIFKRPSIGSASNCKACHQKAEQGIYEDDYVVIPAK